MPKVTSQRLERQRARVPRFSPQVDYIIDSKVPARLRLEVLPATTLALVAIMAGGDGAMTLLEQLSERLARQVIRVLGTPKQRAVLLDYSVHFGRLLERRTLLLTEAPLDVLHTMWQGGTVAQWVCCAHQPLEHFAGVLDYALCPSAPYGVNDLVLAVIKAQRLDALELCVQRHREPIARHRIISCDNHQEYHTALTWATRQAWVDGARYLLKQLPVLAYRLAARFDSSTRTQLWCTPVHHCLRCIVQYGSHKDGSMTQLVLCMRALVGARGKAALGEVVACAQPNGGSYTGSIAEHLLVLLADMPHNAECKEFYLELERWQDARARSTRRCGKAVTHCKICIFIKFIENHKFFDSMSSFDSVMATAAAVLSSADYRMICEYHRGKTRPPALGGALNVQGLFGYGRVHKFRGDRWLAVISDHRIGTCGEQVCDTEEDALVALTRLRQEHNAYQCWHWVDTDANRIVLVNRLHLDRPMRFANNALGLEAVMACPWHQTLDRYRWYASGSIGGRIVKAHQYVAQQHGHHWAIVDHIARDQTLDNSMENLRDGSGGVNSRNCALFKKNTTGTAGVTHHCIKSGEYYRAQIVHCGVTTAAVFRASDYGGSVERAKDAAVTWRLQQARLVGNTNGDDGRALPAVAVVPAGEQPKKRPRSG